MKEYKLVEAISQALADEMHRDETIVVFGEDVGLNGGVFRATDGLQQRFGSERVMDTPLAEAMIGGIAVGMAAQGLKPVAEFQFFGFMSPAFNQLYNHAARMRSRTRGRLSCPAVFRTPFQANVAAPEHHGESMEGIFAGIPGLRIVSASTPQQGYRMLLAAIRCPDPVIFLEPTSLYRHGQEKFDADGEAWDLDRAYVVREGTDVTLVTYGSKVPDCKKAADELEQQGISCEIIDLTSIRPIDFDTILESVEKTGRCIVVHEASRFMGIGAEIAAEVQEKLFGCLQCPVIRVTGVDALVPSVMQEHLFLIKPEKIINAVKLSMEYENA